MRNSSLRAGLVLGLLAGTALPAAASAASYAVTSVGMGNSPGGLSGNISYANGSISYKAAGVGVGRLALSTAAGPNQTSFRSFCVDIFDPLSSGTFSDKAYTSDNLAARVSDDIGAVSFSSTQLSRLAAYIENADAVLNRAGATATQSAAAQLGVWEILFEKSGTAYNVKTGQFSASGSDLGGALDLANTWLGYLTTSDPATKWSEINGQSIGLLDGGERNQQQAYVIRSVGAVPEPASWAMMLAGFGAVGTMVRRRRVAAFA